MNPMNFEEEQDNRIKYIEAVIKTYLPKEEGPQKRVFEAMNYSILAGGKRLRPMLMLETFRLFEGRDERKVAPFMAAIEMIHTYSLVHDDLPAMDDDEYRRGRKTTHVVFGEAMGILAGDGLLNYAFETAAASLTRLSGDDLVWGAKALGILSEKAGIYGMIGGQVIDMEGFGLKLEDDTDFDALGNGMGLTNSQNSHKKIQERLNYMYKLKTGALMEASMMIGAVLAGAGEEDISTVEGMASDIGLAFQVQDDILDVTSTTEIIGKPVHSDEKNNKITYVRLLGIERAREEVVSLSAKGISALESLNKSNDFLKVLIRKLISREK
jgi:geranylgeranyl diphosphate synthase type II